MEHNSAPVFGQNSPNSAAISGTNACSPPWPNRVLIEILKKRRAIKIPNSFVTTTCDGAFQTPGEQKSKIPERRRPFDSSSSKLDDQNGDRHLAINHGAADEARNVRSGMGWLRRPLASNCCWQLSSLFRLARAAAFGSGFGWLVQQRQFGQRFALAESAQCNQRFELPLARP
jgi:hypothetical protein